MRKIFKNHLGALIAWIVIVIIAIFMLPNINSLTRQHSNITLPKDSQSQIADTIQKKWGYHQGNTYQVVAVFNNGNSKMSTTDKQNVAATINKLKNHKSRYGIKSITAPNDNSATKAQLISKDKTTQLVQIMVSKKHGQVKEINQQLTKAIKTSGVKTYVTGSDILNDDFSESIQEGIKKTEVISVIFIFIVLILVFRSPIVPLISLLSVGVSFITSLSIVANLVNKFNFPFSNFTQVFMVIVLFGIGTDYNILLYNQFKDELSRGISNWEATRRARRVAGKTILYSGSSVLIGFSALGLAKFSIYQSAIGVAVGVAVLLFVLLTLNPFFMAVLGKRMFWPSKNFNGEGRSKLWNRLSSSSVLHPVISLAIVLVLTLPFYFMYNNKLNYNDTDEISNSVPSKKGLLTVEDHFSKGTAEPSTIYIRSNHKLDNEKDLKLIDELTRKLQQDPDVKTVASVTQPGGTKEKKLYVSSQLGTVNSGLKSAQTGLGKLSTGSSQMTTGLNQLSTGSQQLVDGMSELTSQLNSQLSSSNEGQISQLESALPQINNGIQELNSSLQSSGTSIDTSSLTSELTNVGNQAKVIGSNLTQAGNTLNSIKTQSSSSNVGSQVISAANSNGANLNAQQQAILTKVIDSAMAQQTSSLTSSLTSVANNIKAAGSADQSLGNSMQSVSGSASSLQSMMSQVSTLKSEVSQLATASNTALPGAATALNQLNTGLTKVQSALGSSQSGVIQINTGINQLAQESPQLTTGINKVNTGLSSGGSYLKGLKNSAAADTYYVPKNILHSKSYKPAIKTYLSEDKKSAKITVVLNTDPSGTKATNAVGRISSIASKSLKGTDLKNATVAMGGQSSKLADTKKTASADFVRTAAIMLVGISLALIFVTRSLLQPLYIIGTLMLAYFTSLSLSRGLVHLIMGKSMLTWNTPFFSFIMLIALGVDYSIFLMMKYREFGRDNMMPADRMVKSAGIIGTVVISAAIILSGTFAALMPSGVPTLIEVAMVVIIGLIILVFIIPVIIPSTVRLTYPVKSGFQDAEQQEDKNNSDDQ